MSSRKPGKSGGKQARGERAVETGQTLLGAELRADEGTGESTVPVNAETTRESGSGRWIMRQPVFEVDADSPLMPVWPWAGHRGWAYDLVRFMKPRVIAELGVHWGTSFFAFAQAVKDGGLSTRLVGVDTWRGDNHTGPYGNEVLESVRGIGRRRFPSVEFMLLPMTFDEALPQVADESIDLLHVDGFHEYAAVEHDFESWLPKLAPDGIVLLHDVAESTGYGSATFWKDLLKKYPGFAFEHSWGLGVVFPKGDRRLVELGEQNLADKIPLYTYRALNERYVIEVKDNAALAVSRMAAMETMEGIIKDRDHEIGLLKGIVSDRDGEIVLLKELVSQRDAQAASLSAESLLLKATGERLGVELVGVRERLSEIEASLRAAQAQADKVSGLEVRITIESRRADAAESVSAGLRTQVAELEAAGAELRSVQERTEASLAETRGRATALEAELAGLKAVVEGLETQRALHLSRIGDVEHRHDIMAANMRAMMVRIAQQQSDTEEVRRQVQEKHEMNEQLKAEMQRVAADVEMLALRVEQLERLEIEREKAGGGSRNGLASGRTPTAGTTSSHRAGRGAR